MPPDLYGELDAKFRFDFDPCPCPRPPDFDGLAVPWGRSSFVNPPFRRRDGFNGAGPGAFVRKAIAENQAGRGSVVVLPTRSYVNLLVEAGAELRSMGRVRWLEVDTKQPCTKARSITAFILRGKP